MRSEKLLRRKFLRNFLVVYRVYDIKSIIAVSKDIDLEADSVLTRVLQAVAVPVLGNVCHVFMHGLNRVQVWKIFLVIWFKVLSQSAFLVYY